MDERKAREILGTTIEPEGNLWNHSQYTWWDKGEDRVTLDDRFTADELEAIAWWMRNSAAISKADQ